jgi:hypothetical protein
MVIDIGSAIFAAKIAMIPAIYGAIQKKRSPKFISEQKI